MISDRLNHFYTGLRNQLFDLPPEDFNIAVAPSIDSFVATAQAKTPLPYTQPTLDIGAYPAGAQMAYLFLNTVTMATRQPSGDAIITTLRVDYLDLTEVAHPLLIFDNRLIALNAIFLQRIILLPITQPVPGTTKQPGILGNLLFTVTQTTAVGAHAITYDLFLNGSFVYAVPEEPIDLLVDRKLEIHGRKLEQGIERILQKLLIPVELAAEVMG